MFFSQMENRADLAFILNIPLNKLTHILYKKNTSNMYVEFEIPKKNGSSRFIETPNEELKSIQKKLLEQLNIHINKTNYENKININISHGFEKNKSIMTNARIHVNKRFVVNIDLADFFHTIHFGRVQGYFEKNKNFNLPRNISIILAQLTTYKGRLPQGAPTSPVIANLICNIFDMRILKIAKKYRLDYTRYADDLSFSTNDKFFLVLEDDFLKDIYNEIKNSGFKVNPDKTRVQYKQSRQEVTGIIVNEKLSPTKKFYKETRAMANSLYSTGKFEINGELADINQLEGRFSFINQFDYENNRIEYERKYRESNDHKSLISDDQIYKVKKNYKKKFYDGLNSREKQYQKFLFYKYFYANPKPVILTEGKTDIKYIKAALKKYADKYQYPTLIQKHGPNEYEYKVIFLKRSKRLRYFLHLHRDGADALKNICNFYINDSPKYPNYINYFKDISNSLPKNPVIMLFDNEKSKGHDKKPLDNTLKHMSKKYEDISEKLYLRVKDNLYFLTHKDITKRNNCVSQLEST